MTAEVAYRQSTRPRRSALPARQPDANAIASLTPVERAVVQALAYADVFDWPLTTSEIHRYLPVAATRRDVEVALRSVARSSFVERVGNLAMLGGRTHLVATRGTRTVVSSRLWPRARAWARIASRLPFVRMVAVTGSLAVDAARYGDDVDLFVVTKPGRLWLTRAMTMLLVRAASIRGLRLCPNYLVAESALRLSDRSLFAAHELAQMVPVAGVQVYNRLIAENGWYRRFLPNAEPYHAQAIDVRRTSRMQALAETILRHGTFDRLERWEMRRKARRLSDASASREIRYDATCCKGHADEHGTRVLAAFDARLERLSEVM